MEHADGLGGNKAIVAQRCLYGVDKHPLAVEMAKLPLWLLTLAKDKPYATVEATDVAILNALVAARTMIGRDDKAIALPHDRLREVLKNYERLAK